MAEDPRDSYGRLVPLRVATLDLSGGLAGIAGGGEVRGTRLLVRRGAQPLGWITIEREGGEVRARDVRDALARPLAAAVGRERVHAWLGAPALPAPPPVSVVVCSRDRADSLGRCLRALAALDYPAWELVVIDNASRDGETARVAGEHGARCVREERPGLDWARNRGIAEARHDIVAFTDDDVEVDAGWLRGIARAFADPAVEMVTGLVAPARLDTRAELLFELGYGGMGKGVRAVTRDPRTMTSRELLGAHHLGVGANMAFRRALLDRLGGFDTALDVGTPARGGGDLDIFHRALAAGALVRYEPQALVWHHHRRDMIVLRRQHYENGRAFGAYLLTALRRGTVPRASVVRYALGTWLRWLAGRIVRRLARREPLPMSLLLAELWGAVHSPVAWSAARWSDRRIRRAAPPPTSPPA